MKAIHTRMMLKKIDDKKYNMTHVLEELFKLEELSAINKSDKFVKVAVWGEGWVDLDCEITNSYGYSLSELIDMQEALNEDLEWIEQYRECDLILKVSWTEPQIGNYPPPNIEVEGHWDWVVLQDRTFNYET